jgi:preprotein translocase subunit SecA
MFGQLSDGIDDDYLQHVFHVSWAEPEPDPEADLSQATYIASEDPSDSSLLAGTDAALTSAGVAGGNGNGSGQSRSAGLAGAGVGSGLGGVTSASREGKGAGAAGAGGGGRVAGVPANPQKIGRNEPCYCGSGKKFKLCHGAN